jgi:nitroimidazol reductase NimA-like FMN-containing flavoprotein (pyridoxamine 5'-phosphate oxidase superfamily)
MRKEKKEIRNRAVIDKLLNTCLVGRLGTIGKDGYPRIKPLNFVYLDGTIFFHSAREGEKIDDINRDNRVVFEIDEPMGFVKSDINPCSARFLYQSIMVKGKAVVVDDNGERLLALKSLMEKYQPEGGYGVFLPEKLAITAVVRIDIEEISGKEDIG